MIEVEHLSKFYGLVAAVQDVSFAVAPGEILGFLGPNGAGKTTTMRVLTCFIPPSAGRVKVAGFDVFDQPLEVRKRIGYLPESVPVYGEMRVEEYLRFVAEVKGIPKRVRKAKIEEVTEECGLQEVRRRLTGKLSKGFRQRVGLAQALLNDPQVLILDEPTIGLDPKQIAEIRSLIKNLAGRRTVILSTHILPEVGMICQRVIIINEGRLIAIDTPDNLTKQLQQSTQISMQIEGPTDQVSKALAQVPGVLAVRPETLPAAGLANYLIEADKGTDVRRALAATVCQHNWGLLALNAVGMSLEDIFLKLVTKEE